MLTLFLAPGADPAGHGQLTPEQPEGTTAASWVHDPPQPVPSAEPNAFAYPQANPRLQDWSERDDVLVFDADPVTAPTDSDFPEFVLHPGTDENPWLAVHTEPTVQTVVLGGITGARLTLAALG
ncbi:putative acyl esterase [Kitasatospora gansuensis]|uniref:Putative acyl esterase n=1 Tax=Kitasatospora gansuensis TaxID=258050 RepID=A0A7W7S8Q7_9ACTN|nr:hypothetical protein [Kitasatospora gansuensis]MBB4945981.1 putative acyl esterase [Kitasatospora gansuensis]